MKADMPLNNQTKLSVSKKNPHDGKYIHQLYVWYEVNIVQWKLSRRFDGKYFKFKWVTLKTFIVFDILKLLSGILVSNNAG